MRIRAFGTYAMHVSDPAVFLRQLVATDPSFEAYEISNQMRNTIVSRFADVLGTAKMPILDMAGNYDKLSQLAFERIKPDLASLGLALTLFYVENISLPEEVEAALDTRAKIGAVGDLNQYTRYQTGHGHWRCRPQSRRRRRRRRRFGGRRGDRQPDGRANGDRHGGRRRPAPAAAIRRSTSPSTASSRALTISARWSTLVHQGKISRDSLVWRQGLTQWVAAEQLARTGGGVHDDASAAAARVRSRA